MFRTMSVEKYIESATSHLHLETDWPTIILICDAIRQGDVSPKNAIALIKKKIVSSNPHTAMYALIVLESVVKNCGAPIHDEISTKTNCEMYTNLINTTTHENVRNKMLELIQCWAYAFRSTPKYRAIKDTMNILKTEGRTFPELKEADAMFTSDTAPDWVDGEVCDRCRVAFSFTQRKHHCRNCGQVFCGQCSAKTSTLPKYGIEKEVRVCDGCFEVLQKPNSTPAKTTTTAASGDLPAIYLSSTLAQQAQTPARKTEEELKEEEEFQLALALSQSEAEEAEKKKLQYSKASSYNSSPARTANASPPAMAPAAPAEETDPELARYLNRNYWEQQQQKQESPASPSAPIITPVLAMAQAQMGQLKVTDEEAEIEDFSQTMRSQVEIFVNRMKSNSSRGRSIANDSSVQTMFMNLTSHHAKLLTYIKAMDEKRMWYEQLQDKLAQVKDSRAALDVLRQEHQEKLRRQAEEAERQRQMQMAQKLEMMRKKKQEFLQYQRQMAVHRIQEQERAYHQGYQQPGMGMMGPGGFNNSSPQHHHYNPAMGMGGSVGVPPGAFHPGQGPNAGGGPYGQGPGQMGGPVFHQQQPQMGHHQFPGQPQMPGVMGGAPPPGVPHGAGPMPGHPQMMHHPQMNHPGMNSHPGMDPNHQQSQHPQNMGQMGQLPTGHQQQQHPQMPMGNPDNGGGHQQQQHNMGQIPQQMNNNPPVLNQQQQPQPPSVQPVAPPQAVAPEAAPQPPAPAPAAVAPVPPPAEVKAEEPSMAELISFD